MSKAVEMRDYKQDIKINEYDLEQEWVEQASLFLYYAEAHADALHNKDIAKSKLEYVYAVMYSKIKAKWESYFENKPTEPAIKEFILSHKKFKIAERKYMSACHEANLMLAAKTAFEHRKLALSNLASLKIGGFYSEPRNRVQDIKNIKERKKENQQKMRKNQKMSLKKSDRWAKTRLNTNK